MALKILVCLSALLVCSDAFRQDSRVNSDSLESRRLGKRPTRPLCAKAIVTETCALISGGSAHSSLSEGLADILAATQDSVDSMWTEAGLSDSISCSDLCLSLVDFLGSKTTVPPESDMGCLELANGTMQCDIDLDAEVLNNRAEMGNKDLPDFHDRNALTEDKMLAWDAAKDVLDENVAQNVETYQVSFTKKKKDVSYEVLELAIRVANLFRIYPTNQISVTDEIAAQSDDFWSDEAEVSTAKFRKAKGPACSKYRKNTGPRCEKQTGCTWWHAKGCVPEPKTCSPYRKTLAPMCDDQPGCKWIAGEGCKGKKKNGGGGTPEWKIQMQKRGIEAQAYVSTAFRKFKARDTEVHMKKWFGEQSYSNKDTRKEIGRLLNSLSTMLGKVEYRFPGKDCDPTTYAYVEPRGPGAKNKKGQFIFDLCQLYLDSPISEQIETMTHEGSHHATAFTDDVCLDEFHGGDEVHIIELPLAVLPSPIAPDDEVEIEIQGEEFDAYVHHVKENTAMLQLNVPEDCDNTAYGREECEELAELNPVKALRNADNLCYYIQDITDLA